MTTALALPAPVDTGWSRVASIARVQIVSWRLLLAWPIAILAVAFTIPWVIFALVDTGQQYNVTGSVLSAYGFVVAFYMVSMTQMMPFTIGLGSTRRQFVAAVTAIGLAESFVFAAAFQTLSVLEAATGGWGVDMRMFGVLRFVTDSTVLQFLCYFATMSFVVALAMLLGAIQHRWPTTGILAAGAVVIGVGGLAAIVLTWTQSWSSLWSWSADSPRAVTLVALPLCVAAACLAGAWQVVRNDSP
ncbi:MAG: hypothetical protein GXY65_04355 [Rhodococcus sp.]|uniref:hypothetical protein n=1 Tax=Rhodococcus TaxID=1827 RepID=UPI0016BD038B|nr:MULTISPECIES: hypothetical protein [Rhodococcus]NLV78569.1 hypothetical protein [Rhodococcus sp. (in: high G+C Gram-positive bacteria)]